MPEHAATHVVMGRIGAPYGIKGWVKLYSFADPAENLLEYRQFWLPVDGGGLQEIELDSAVGGSVGVGPDCILVEGPPDANALIPLAADPGGARHVAAARWTFPMWVYVSTTGVVVYWMLYRMYPPP